MIRGVKKKGEKFDKSAFFLEESRCLKNQKTNKYMTKIYFI